MNLAYADKIVLVTGGSSGIGRAASMAFAHEGATVVIASTKPSGGYGTVELIEKAGGSAIFIKCDVSNALEVEELINSVVTKFGRLDCAFNNAGIPGEITSTADCTEPSWNKVIDVNLKGVWLCMKFELRQMLKQGNGVIVNCASIAGLIGATVHPAYVASKHGVIGLTKTAALECAKARIRINAICPGGTQTPLLEPHLDTPILAAMINQIPQNRLAKPEEIADAVLWLCSDQASYVTGHALVVDGGFTAQ